MCQFCDSLLDRKKKMKLLVRSTFAEDDICEVLNDSDCNLCDDCGMSFGIEGYKVNNNFYISIDYEQKIRLNNDKVAIIKPFSESIHVNYCPICGTQLSEHILDLIHQSEFKIVIDEGEWFYEQATVNRLEQAF